MKILTSFFMFFFLIGCDYYGYDIEIKKQESICGIWRSIEKDQYTSPSTLFFYENGKYETIQFGDFLKDTCTNDTCISFSYKIDSKKYQLTYTIKWSSNSTDSLIEVPLKYALNKKKLTIYGNGQEQQYEKISGN